MFKMKHIYFLSKKIRWAYCFSQVVFLMLILSLSTASTLSAQTYIDEKLFNCNTPHPFVNGSRFGSNAVSVVGGEMQGSIPIFFPLPWTGAFGPAGVLGGTVTSEGNAIDGNTGNSAKLTALIAALGNGERLTIASNIGRIPAGYYAGFDIKNTAIFGATISGVMRIKTYLGNSLQETSEINNGSLSMNVANDQGVSRVGFVTSKDFDRIMIEQSQILSINLGTTEVYNAVIMKLCPESQPRPCNQLEYWINPDFPVIMKAEHTGIANLLCANCTVKNTSNLIDADLNNFATIDFLGAIASTGSVAVKNTKTAYPAGTFAGFDVQDDRLLTISIGARHTITTYLNGVEQESVADGGALASGGFFTSTGRIITGFRTRKSFDEIRLQVSNAGTIGAAPIKIFGAVIKSFCAGQELPCNVNTNLVDKAYPVYVDGRNTAIDALGCIQCNIIESDNAIDAIPDNYTTVVIPVNVATTAAYAVASGGNVYNTNPDKPVFAGFDIDNPNLIGIDALSGLTVATTLNGVVQQSVTKDNGLVSAKSSVLNGAGRQVVGFIPNGPFDGVKITFSSFAKANIGSTRIFSAIFKQFCKNDLACNALTATQNPAHPVYVDGVRTAIESLGCVACQLNNSENIVNGSGNPATLIMGVGVGAKASVAVANAIETYPAESFAGFEIESASLLSANVLARINVTLYNNGVAVQSGTGQSMLVGASTSLITGGPNRQIIGLISRVPAFDEVQMNIENLAGVDLGTIKIYKAHFQRNCPATVTCNMTGMVDNTQKYGAVVDAALSGVKGGVCIGCSINGPWDAVSASLADFTRLYNTGSIAINNSLAIATPAYTYPAGTFAGFAIKKNNFIAAAAIFPSITIETYNNGQLQESKSAGSLIDFTALIQWIGTPVARYTPGFITTKPFDEVRIVVSSLAAVLDQYIDVYGAYVDVRTIRNGSSIGLNCNLLSTTQPDEITGLPNKPIEGNVSTNDHVTPGTTYGNPSGPISQPPGSTPKLTMQPDGRFVFTSNVPGVYMYDVPVCAPGQTSGCPTERLIVNVENPDPEVVYDPPIAYHDEAVTLVNNAVTVPVRSNDVPGNFGGTLNTPTITGGNNPGANATIDANGNLVYTPPAGFVGTDTVFYKVCESPAGLCASSYVIITVIPSGVSNSTMAVNDQSIGMQNHIQTGNVLTNDRDAEGDVQRITLIDLNEDGVPETAPTGNAQPILQNGVTVGTVKVNATTGAFVITPVQTFSGTINIAYEVTDNNANAAKDKATLVSVVVPDEFILREDMNVGLINTTIPGSVSTNDNVPSGTTYGNPSGFISQPPGSTPILTMQPDGRYVFTTTVPGVYVYDIPVCPPGQTNGCATSRLIISVKDPLKSDNPPIVNNDQSETVTGQPVKIPVKNNDMPGNTGGVLGQPSVATPPSNGTATINTDGTITYTPKTGFTGTDQFTYQVCEQPGNKCSTATVTVTVRATGASNSTTAEDDLSVGKKGQVQTGNVLTNDHDAEGDVQRITLIDLNGDGIPETVPDGSAQSVQQNGVTVGTVNINAATGAYIFTPVPTFSGTINIAYEVTDNNANAAKDKATLVIVAVPLPDLTPVIRLPFNNFSVDQSKNCMVELAELQNVKTASGVITFSITAPVGYAISFDGSLQSLVVQGVSSQQELSNKSWSIIATQLNGRRLVFQAKSDFFLNGLGLTRIGFSLKRTTATSGSSPVVTVNVSDNASGVYDSNSANNIFTRVLNSL